MGSLSPSFRRARFDLILGREVSTVDSIRCLPDLVHFNAINNPDHTFCVQSKQSTNPEEQLESVHITFSELAQAIERCCEWIVANIGGTQSARIANDGSVQKSHPVALFLESDLTLFIYLVALLTLNVPCLLLSIRLSPHAVQHLLRETGSASIIVSPRTRLSIQDALKATDIPRPSPRMIVAATFETFIHAPVPAALYRSHLLDCRRTVRENDREVLILHSSGTTGLPKAIPLAHRYLLGYAACHEFPDTEDLSRRGYNLSTLPLFHGFGVLAPCLALSVGMPVWFPPSTTIPNASLVIAVIKGENGKITSLMTVPTILEDISLAPNFDLDVVSGLARLDFVAVGGGGIKTSVGQKLHAAGVNLLNHFGATELGALAPIFQPREDYDWTYLRLRTDLGLKLEILEAQDGQPRSCKLIGFPFAWNEKFELQDILEANPLNPGSEVRILGRNDDLIVLATGEKVLPHPLEHELERHPAIRRAIVFGNGQFEIGVLLEPLSESLGSPDVFIDFIWPKIQDANKLMDNHARISSKAAVLIKPVNKDIPLTDKGSVRRKEVYVVFSPEISSVYSSLAQDDANALSVPFDVENPKRSLRAIAQSCLPAYNGTDTWADDSDFIALGMDSLQATRFRRTLQASLRSSGCAASASSDLPLDIIYSHPSISSLVKALNGWIRGSISGSNPAGNMASLTEKYAYHSETLSTKSNSVVLITGSTGNLGANLLQMLGEDRRTQGIVCLIRSRSKTVGLEELVALQRKALADRGIILSPNAWSKVKCVSWLPGADNLGMPKNEFQNLASRLTHIFHGAWPMDFKVKVQSLEPQIKAVRELLELGRLAHASKSHIKPRVILASSIAVVGQYPLHTKSALVPEIPMDNPQSPLPIGYAEAKWVCEKVMESAQKHIHCIEPSIIRIGQLSGSEATGFWSSKEHMPTLIKASQAVGAMPDLRGSLSWLPVDRAARIITDILLNPRPRNLIYHLENPIRQSWPDMCTIIERSISLPLACRLPFQEWLDRVSSTNENPQDLMDFFQHHFLRMSSGALVLDTTEARRVSPTLRSTGAVGMRDVESYLGYWRGVGCLK